MGEVVYLQTNFTALADQEGGTQGWPTLGRFGGLKVNQTAPQYHGLAEAGRIYSWSSATATAKAPVTAIPTTAAIFALWNGNAAATRLCLSILRISAWQVSGTAGLGKALIAGLSPTSQTAVTSATNAIKTNLSASARTSAATFGTDITLGGTPSWNIYGGSDQPAAVQVGGGVTCRLDGEILVPPGYALGLSVLSPVGTTALYGMSVIYAEVEASLV